MLGKISQRLAPNYQNEKKHQTINGAMTSFGICLMMAFLLLPMSVKAADISANSVRQVQEYTGQATVMFAPDESFEILADNILQVEQTSIYSGTVQVKFAGTELTAETVAVTKRDDGTTVLQSEKFLLIPITAE